MKLLSFGIINLTTMGRSRVKMKNNTNYLTISELGRLRNVDSKSLRYYERIGALIPAYVDPDTQYRYYTVGQLVDLDTILLCLEMGIPLKEASKYREEDGTLAVKSLFEDGKRVMDDKIRKYEAIMARLQYSLDCINENAGYKNRNDFYIRHIHRRFIIKEPLENPTDFLCFSRQSVAVFTKAKEQGLEPGYAFPIGILLERGSGPSINASIFLEIMAPPEGTNQVCVLEERDYRCYQESQTELFQSHGVYEKLLTENVNIDSVIITNMALDTYRHDTFPIEVQV